MPLKSGSAPTVPGVDGRRHYLFLKSAPEFGDFVCELLRRIAGSKLLDRIEIQEKSAQEMGALMPDAGSDVPEAVLEEVIAGPSSLILDFVTPNEIQAELTKLEGGQELADGLCLSQFAKSQSVLIDRFHSENIAAFTDGKPARGELKAANVMIAGDDRVAVDAVGLAMLRSN